MRALIITAVTLALSGCQYIQLSSPPEGYLVADDKDDNRPAPRREEPREEPEEPEEPREKHHEETEREFD